MSKRDITPRTLAAGQLLIRKQETLQKRITEDEPVAADWESVTEDIEYRAKRSRVGFGDKMFNIDIEKNYDKEEVDLNAWRDGGRVGLRPNTETREKFSAIAEQMNISTKDVMFDVRWYARRNRHAHSSQLNEDIANKRWHNVAVYARNMQRQLEDILPDDLLSQKFQFHNAISRFLEQFFIAVDEVEAGDRG
ncbi:MAG: hypothetical protein MMC33_010857 [Icmadophila ericetorum]|nr:hypothetical protein [Icmadophila ericetorum]